MVIGLSTTKSPEAVIFSTLEVKKSAHEPTAHGLGSNPATSRRRSLLFLEENATDANWPKS